jgi:hypothetical protein
VTATDPIKEALGELKAETARLTQEHSARIIEVVVRETVQLVERRLIDR